MNRLADLVSCLRRKDIQSYEQGQEIQTKLVSVASQVEKLCDKAALREEVTSRFKVCFSNRLLVLQI